MKHIIIIFIKLYQINKNYNKMIKNQSNKTMMIMKMIIKLLSPKNDQKLRKKKLPK